MKKVSKPFDSNINNNNNDIISNMFIDEKEHKMLKLRTQFILNGVLQPKQINKKKTKKRKKR